MVAAGRIGRDQLGRTVPKHNAAVVTERRVPDRRLNAYAGRCTREYERVDPFGTKNGVKRRFEEGAVSMFGDHSIAWSGLKFRDDCRIPSVANEDLASGAARCLHCRADVHAPVLDPMRGILVPRIGEVGIVFLPGVDDKQSRTPRCLEHPGNRLNEGRNRRDIKASTVEHSSMATEVILHIDDHNGRPARVEAYRLRLGGD